MRKQSLFHAVVAQDMRERYLTLLPNSYCLLYWKLATCPVKERTERGESQVGQTAATGVNSETCPFKVCSDI